MHARIAAYALTALALAAGIALVWDALVTTDEERLEELADTLASERAVEGVLAWTDPARAPLRVRDGEGLRTYGEQDEADLAMGLSQSLSPIAGSRVDVVQRAIDVRGDRATLALRLRVDGDLHDLGATAVRDGQGWLVSELRVR